MNKVILIGRLTRDPDIRYSQGENSTAVARYTLAVDRRFTSQDGQREADFIGCVAFGKAAEFAERYLHQGIKIAVVGRIQTGSYTNKDGQKIYTTDVVVEEQEFAESKAASDGRQNGGGYNGGNGYSSGRGNGGNNGGNGYNNGRGNGGGGYNGGNGGYNSRPQEDPTVGEGFMNIPEGVEDEGLPFNSPM